jgi:CheY-like chemotaxis protein
MKKKIFCLDDSFERHKLFREKFSNDNIIFAISAKEAIDILSEDMEWDIICLDHDLGEEIEEGSNLINNGYEVAKFLATKNPKCLVIIHTGNFWGAVRMMSALPQADYIPYFFQKENGS